MLKGTFVYKIWRGGTRPRQGRLLAQQTLQLGLQALQIKVGSWKSWTISNVWKQLMLTLKLFISSVQTMFKVYLLFYFCFSFSKTWPNLYQAWEQEPKETQVQPQEFGSWPWWQEEAGTLRLQPPQIPQEVEAIGISPTSLQTLPES